MTEQKWLESYINYQETVDKNDIEQDKFKEQMLKDFYELDEIFVILSDNTMTNEFGFRPLVNFQCHTAIINIFTNYDKAVKWLQDNKNYHPENGYLPIAKLTKDNNYNHLYESILAMPMQFILVNDNEEALMINIYEMYQAAGESININFNSKGLPYLKSIVVQ